MSGKSYPSLVPQSIVVDATFQVADAILLVVALSYLGLGIRPPQTDWGRDVELGAERGL